MDKQWMPEVGELVEYVDVELEGEGFITRPAEFVAEYKGKYILAFPDMSGGVVASDIRPVKSEADKYRDEQVQQLSVALLMKQLVTAGDLYDYGCRVIAPDEYVVKALTDEQRANIRRGTYVSDCDIEAVQRELGIEV